MHPDDREDASLDGPATDIATRHDDRKEGHTGSCAGRVRSAGGNGDEREFTSSISRIV